MHIREAFSHHSWSGRGLHPATRSGFSADCGADLYPGAHRQAPSPSSAVLLCTGYGHPLRNNWRQTLRTPYTLWFIVHALYLRLQQVITLCPLDCVYPDAVDAHDAGNTLTGDSQLVATGPTRAHHAGYPPEALFFHRRSNSAFAKIRGSPAQDIVAAAQFAVFTLQFLPDADVQWCSVRRHLHRHRAHTDAAGTPGPRTADFRGDGADGPLRVSSHSGFR